MMGKFVRSENRDQRTENRDQRTEIREQGEMDFPIISDP
jgi:hypothetical protein